VAEKLRSDIEALRVGSTDRPARTSASFGVVTYPDDGTTMEELIADVDKAMYESKRRGKNQIVGFTTHTQRVATPMAERRTTMMERPGSRPSAAPTPAAPPPTAARGTGPRPPTQPPTPPQSAPQRPVARPPSGQGPTGRPAWDSTSPAGPPSGGRTRPDDARPYVAFPVEGGGTGTSSSAPVRDPRDFTGR
jgi:hypothetical protein